MNRRIYFILIVFLVTVIACSSLKRHAGAEYRGEDPSLADIGLFGYKIYESDELSTPGNLWDLNATAQANLLEILDRRFSGNESFLKALNNRYTTEITGIGSYTNKNLRLILTVSKKRDYRSVGRNSHAGHPAADRIEYLRIRLRLPQDIGLQFTNWNRFTTEYADIRVAGVTFNRSADLSSEAGITSEEETIERNANAGIKASVSQKEEQTVKYRYLKMNGKLSDKIMEIEEEGTREIDLTGNIITDVSLSFSGFPEKIFIPVYNKEENDLVSVQLMETDIMVPRLTGMTKPVMADLEMEFVYRHVSSGSDTFQEWDDVVEYYTGTVKKEIKLLDKYDYLPPFHCIGIQSSEKEIITVRSNSGKSYALIFGNYAEALGFQEWLLVRAGNINKEMPLINGDYSLWFRGEKLSPGKLQIISGLKVLPYYE